MDSLFLIKEEMLTQSPDAGRGADAEREGRKGGNL
jgi:hypothetical protein